MNSIYENDLIRIEVETSEVPWLKIFTKEDKKEFSECTVSYTHLTLPTTPYV